MAFKKLFANFRSQDLNAYLAELNRRIALADADAAELILASNARYVGADGNDDTAVMGSLKYKYATLQAAVDDSDPSVGEVVVVVDGADSQNVVIPSQGGYIFGLGSLVATGNISFTLTEDSPLALVNVSCGDVVVDGSGIVDAFATELGTMIDCSVAGDVTLTRLGDFDIRGSDISGTMLSTNSNGDVDRCLVGAYRRYVRYSDLQPQGGPEIVRLRFCRLGSTSIEQQAQCTAHHCDLNDLILDVIDDDPVVQGLLRGSNCHCGNVEVRANFRNGVGPHETLQLDASVITGEIATDATAGGIRSLVNMRCSSFAHGNRIVAGGLISMDLAGSSFQQVDLFNAGVAPDEGRVNRDLILIMSSVASNPPAAVSIRPPLLDARYVAIREEIAGPDSDVIVSEKLYNQFTAAGYSAGSVPTPGDIDVNWVIHHNVYT